MPYEYLIYEKKGHIAYITLNRPRVLNCIHPPMQRELIDALGDANNDADMWVIILTGAGDRAFCSGADIKYGAEHPEEARQLRTTSVFDQRASMVAGMLPLEIWKPMIAAVNGYCLGGGLEVALCCDIIIASEAASFGVPEITIGGMPGGGGVFRLPRCIPQKMALKMILTGDRIPAEEAYRLGLVAKVVPQAELMAEATKLAERLCENPPLSLQAAKQVVMRGLDIPLDYPPVAWHLLQPQPNVRAMESEDRIEARQAWLEKRKPSGYKGR